jgi:hypothetical protein
MRIKIVDGAEVLSSIGRTYFLRGIPTSNMVAKAGLYIDWDCPDWRRQFSWKGGSISLRPGDVVAVRQRYKLYTAWILLHELAHWFMDTWGLSRHWHNRLDGLEAFLMRHVWPRIWK